MYPRFIYPRSFFTNTLRPMKERKGKGKRKKKRKKRDIH